MLFWKLKELDKERKSQLNILGVSTALHVFLLICLIVCRSSEKRLFDLSFFMQAEKSGARVTIAHTQKKQHAPSQRGVKRESAVGRKPVLAKQRKQPEKKVSAQKSRQAVQKKPIAQKAIASSQKAKQQKPEVAPAVSYSPLPKKAEQAPKPVEKKVPEKIVEAKKPEEKMVTQPQTNVNMRPMSFRFDTQVNASGAVVSWETHMQAEMAQQLDMPQGFEDHAPLLVSVAIDRNGKPEIVSSTGCEIPVVVASAQTLLLKYRYPKQAWGSQRDFLF